MLGNPIVYGFGLLSIFTFFIPLFLSGIPGLQHKRAIQHDVPVNLGVHISNVANTTMIPCGSNLDFIYQQLGLCISPEYFSGYCSDSSSLVMIHLVDVTFNKENTVYTDRVFNQDLPLPFDRNRFSTICSTNWIYDPVDDLFVNGDRIYTEECYRSDYMECKSFGFTMFMICLIGSGVGTLLGCLAITLIDLVWAGWNLGKKGFDSFQPTTSSVENSMELKTVLNV